MRKASDRMDRLVSTQGGHSPYGSACVGLWALDDFADPDDFGVSESGVVRAAAAHHAPCDRERVRWLSCQLAKSDVQRPAPQAERVKLVVAFNDG